MRRTESEAEQEEKMQEFTAFFNGEWVPYSDVKIDPFDRGFLMGDSIYDVERTFDGKIFRLREHMERLYRSLQYTRIDPGLTQEEMGEVTEEVVRRNESLRSPSGDFSVRQVVTRGRSPSYSQGMPDDAVSPTVIVTALPIDFGHARHYEDGAAVVFPTARSYSANSLDPKAKHYSRANFVQAQLQAADIDPNAYPVLLDQDGNIAENVGGNFMIVSGGAIRTSSDRSILQGISRMTVFDLAEQLEIPVVEEDLQPYDAYTADEAFLTNSIYQLLPVATIDGRQIGDEVPGPVSKRLLAAWSELVGVDIVDQALQAAR